MPGFPFRKTLLASVFAGVMLTAAPDDAAAADPNPQVLMKTSLGDIVIELYP